MPKTVGVVFPGYGEQFIGMGKDLYDEVRIVQEFFETAAGSSEKNFVKLIFASSDEEISSIRHAYAAIFLIECSLYEILRQKGLKPDFVAGYGIGEYTACFAAQSLSFVDGMYFVNKYAQFYHEFIEQQEIDYSVLRIPKGYEFEQMQQFVKDLTDDDNRADIAARNTQQGVYVSGTVESLDQLKAWCVEGKVRKVREIGPGYGLHSSVMDPVVEKLKLYYHKIEFKNLHIPVITNVDGVYVTTADALQASVMRRINNPVLWYDVMQGFEGCDVILSVGPGKQLQEWILELYPDKECHTVATLKDIEVIEHLFKQEEQDVDRKSSQVKVKKDDKEKNLLDADMVNERASDYDVDDE